LERREISVLCLAIARKEKGGRRKKKPEVAFTRGDDERE
jgi:hypothetical protein